MDSSSDKQMDFSIHEVIQTLRSILSKRDCKFAQIIPMKSFDLVNFEPLHDVFITLGEKHEEERLIKIALKHSSKAWRKKLCRFLPYSLSSFSSKVVENEVREMYLNQLKQKYNILTAYTGQKYEIDKKLEENGFDTLVLILIGKSKNFMNFHDNVADLTLLFRGENEVSQEASYLIRYDLGVDPIVQSIAIKELLKKHSNVTNLNTSRVKSSGFKKRERRLINKTTIVIHCQVKGIIPFGEKLFPKVIEGYQVDVREGVCYFAARKIKIGEKVSNPECKTTGTLGGFVNIPGSSRKGFITAAHSVIPPEKDFSKTFPKVYVNNDSETFEVGEVKCARFEHGIPEETSIDAALVEINEHLEVEHSWNISKNNEELSEISRCKLSATKITDVMSSDFDQSKSVLIYGATTGLSLGKLKVAGCHARFNNYILVTKGVVPAVTFFNQCEIIKTSPGTLIEEGDSGAFVYSFDKSTSELSCLGMIIGGTSYGSAIMTPIGPVLKALGLQTESLLLIDLHRKPVASVPGVPQTKVILTPSNVDQTIQPKLAPDITDITKTLKQTGFRCLIPYVVHAYSQLQGKDVLSSDPESEINKYYDKLLIQDQKPVFVVTGITGMGKTTASLLLLKRFKNANEATPLAVTNVRELESIRVLPNITFTILVDGLFDHIESLKIINANISILNKIRRLLYNWSGKNTMIITMQKEVLNFLKNSHTGKDFFQSCFVVDFTNTADINTQDILYHINDMDECCFECLSSVLLKPGFSFQNVDIPKRCPSDFFRNDFMIQEKIAESFLDIYLEKKNGLFFIKDRRIRNILCKIHIERNAQEFFKRCPLNYLCDFLSHDKTCSIEVANFEILISRIFDNVKKYPSYCFFEDFVRLCQIQNFQKYLFWTDSGNASLSKTPKTTRALLANLLAERGEEDYSSIIGMLVNDHFDFSNYAGMSKDDASCLSEEKITPIRSSFMAIACEFDLQKYRMGYKRKNNASFRIPNKLLENLLTRRYIEDSLVENIFIRAIEQNFCSEFALYPDAIWTGYTINKRDNTCEKYVIVVRKEKIKEIQTKKIPSKYCGLEVCIKGIFDVEAESIAILKEEAKYNLDEDVIIHDSVIDTLLKAHSNITGITASSVLSMNYNSNKPHKIKPSSCIVISCHTKGVIPVGEKPFPTNINGYPVDVRESCSATSAIRHPQIGDSIKSSTDGMREGTLGGFVFIGRKTVYYLTSAHVLVVKIHLNEKLFDVAKTLDTNVLRQVSHEWKECGKLVRGYFGEISLKRKVTVDAILVSVNSVDHEPRDVFLPQENLMNAGFLEDSKPYFIGRIKDVSSLDTCKSLNIVKYGQTTSWTKGRIIAINAMRRTRISANGDILKPYRGQIVIKSDQGKFADLGDSGSLVFSVEDYEDPELQCIGLLNSVNEISFEVNITPIRAVLESLKLNENAFVKLDPPFSLKYFNILKETQNMHTDILLNIEEYTRRPEL